MAVKDIKWSYMPVTGNDITGAFNSARDGLNTSLDYLDKYMEVKSEIATGEAQNALSQAEDALTVNTILQEAMDNSWIDNSALGDAGTKKKDTMFSQDIDTQKLNEMLLDNAHGRGMREAEFGLSSARLSNDIFNQNRNYDLNFRKAMNEEYFKDLDYGYKEQERAEDSEYNKARTQKLKVETAGMLGGKSGSGKSSAPKTVSLQDALYNINDGGKTQDAMNSLLYVATTNKDPAVISSVNDSLVSLASNVGGIDVGKTINEFNKESHNRRNAFNQNRTSLSVNKDYRDARDTLKVNSSNKEWNDVVAPINNTMLTVTASTGGDGSNLANFTNSMGRFIKDSSNIEDGAALYDILQSTISKMPNGKNIESEVLNDSFTYQTEIDTSAGRQQKTVFRTKTDFINAMKLLEKYIKF